MPQEKPDRFWGILDAVSRSGITPLSVKLEQKVYQPHASRCVVAKMEVANDGQRGRLARMGKAPERLASEA